MSAYVYRRGSIFWALTLITVGILFLYQNFNPAIHPWEILAKFWPVVIIFWGASKLIDHIQARAHPESTPPPLFSASEVILLVLVLITGTVVSKVVLHQWSWLESGINGGNSDDWDGIFTNSYTYTQTVSAPAGGPQPHLVLVDHHGDVELRSVSEAGLQASIKEVVHASNDQEAKKISDRLKFEFVHQGGQYTLQSNIDSLGDSARNVRLDIVLSLPAAATTDVTVEHGDLTASGLKGDQNFTVDHGDAHITQVEGLVKLRKTGGSTQVSNVKGSVELEGHGDDVQISDVTGAATVNGDFSGDVEFSNVGQTLHYLSPRTDLTTQQLTGRLTMDSGSLEANGVRGPFEINTRAKDINLDGFAHSVKITNTDGDIQLRAAAALTHPIEVQSNKGEIQISIPPNSAFQIDAVSRHGEVDSEFNGPDLKVNNSGDQPSITGSYGKGGPTIHLSTAYGTIHLGQGEASMPPTPPEPPAAPTPSSRT
ncbi:MAG TPA: DUF4097 family beta strand repeat-containing protein [Terriglobia bacterium]|jgi:hypothetical protein|nr:DUF4097 family beta strand repeat-containing protein [Terriglobia bacterium]